MTDEELLLHAKDYIDKLANGVNPLTGEFLPDTDIVNNVRISRCLFYVSGVLGDVANGKIKPKEKEKKPKKGEFNITPEQLLGYDLYEKNVTVSQIADKLNELKATEELKDIKAVDLNKWLLENNILKLGDVGGREAKIPTEKGEEIGVLSEQRRSLSGYPYLSIFYGEKAQHYIIDNIQSIVDFLEEKEQLAEDEKKEKTSKGDRKNKAPFYLSEEQLKNYDLLDNTISITQMVERLNSLADLEQCEKLSYQKVVAWLIDIKFLEIQEINGKPTKVPSAMGSEMGIMAEERRNAEGVVFTVVYYTRSAQQFIIDNLDAIVEFNGGK